MVFQWFRNVGLFVSVSFMGQILKYSYYDLSLLEERSIRHDGIDRYFLKPRQAPSEGAPLVILLHGASLSMTTIFGDYTAANRKWIDLSFERDFLLLVPNGTRRRFACWFNCVDSKGDDMRWNYLPGQDVIGTAADDVGFLLKLVKWSQDNYSIDPSRVYLAGYSNGGMMTFRMLYEYPDVFAAGAAFNANLPARSIDLPVPNSPRPIFIMNGNKDPIVKWEGGTIGSGITTDILKGVLQSSLATRDWFIRANGVSPVPHVETLPDLDPDDGCHVISEFYAGNSPVAFFEVNGGGHTIPSLDVNPVEPLFTSIFGTYCHDVEGVELGWSFLSASSL